MRNITVCTKRMAVVLVGLALLTFIVTSLLVNQEDQYLASFMPIWAAVPKITFQANMTSGGGNDSRSTKKGTLDTYIKCKCSLTKKYKSSHVLQQYSSKIHWLNVSTVDYLSRLHPNWPSYFFLEIIKSSKACNLLPTEFKQKAFWESLMITVGAQQRRRFLLDIEWRNVYWQEVSLSKDSKVLLYSAFYDTRKVTNLGPCIRLLGVSSSVKLPKAWCHLWFDLKSPPVVSRITAVEHIDYQKPNRSYQMPYLLKCDIPKDMAGIPKAVSLVNKPCARASNILKVTGAKERDASSYIDKEKPRDSRDLKGHSPAVCGTALYYYHDDFSFRMVEWLEMLREMKFGKVYLHLTDVHPNIGKVLRHYEKEGFVSVTMYAYPPPYINEPATRRMWTLVQRDEMYAQENIYFTDCLLRHMHEHRFIAHYDPDELPVLPKHNNYTQFLDELLEKNGNTSSQLLPPAYLLQWRFFNDDIKPTGVAAQLPNHLWILRHIRRPSKDIKPRAGSFKPLYDMNLVRGVSSHGVQSCVTGKCERKMKQIPLDVAYVGHFKRACGSECQGNASATIEEPVLHRNIENISKAVKKVLEELELIPKQS